MTDQIPNKYEEFDSVPQDLSEGPRKDRSCTDLSCCFIFFLFTALTILIAFVGLMAGNPAILAQPYDMDHHPCGINGNADYPYIYFPSPKNLKSNVCIKACPIKDQEEIECLVNKICPSGTMKQDVSKSQLIYETIPVADKICIPLNQEYFKSIKASVNIGGIEQIASDLRNTWMICSSSVLSAIILGFIFMYLVRLMAGSIVWSFVLVIFVSLASLGLLFLFQYLQLTNPPEMDKVITENSQYKAMANIMSQFKDKDQVLIAGVVFSSLALIFIVAICCMCEKIRLGVQVIKASARFMTENPRITLVPIVSFVISTAFFALWFVIALYLYSSGGVSKQEGTLPFAHVHIGTDIKVLGWTHLFGLFWYESFFAACQQMIIIGAVAFWYFKADETEDSNTTMSAKLFFKNHMGTAAFGSFLLGVLAFIKFLLSLISEQAQSLKDKGDQNSCFQYVYKVLYCFVYLFEKCFKHLNLSAYVWTMMDGKNFCPSAQRALSLYVMNPVRMSLIAGIGELFEFLGCAAICGATTLSCYFIITKTEYYTERVDNPLAPVLVIAITSYYVGSFVMSLFGTVSEALITIFSIEEGMRSPSKKCPEELKEFMDSVDSR